MSIILIHMLPKWGGYLFVAVGIAALICTRYVLAIGEELEEQSFSLRKRILPWTANNTTEKLWVIEKSIKKVLFFVLYVPISIIVIIGGLITILK